MVGHVPSAAVPAWTSLPLRQLSLFSDAPAAGFGLALGFFVGLQRKRRGKEAGLRSFGFAALLGGLGGLPGDAYAVLGVGLLGISGRLPQLGTLCAGEGFELTTSAAP